MKFIFRIEGLLPSVNVFEKIKMNYKLFMVWDSPSYLWITVGREIKQLYLDDINKYCNIYGLGFSILSLDNCRKGN